MSERPPTDWQAAVAFAFWGGDQVKILQELRGRGADVMLLPAIGPGRAVWVLKRHEIEAAKELGARRAMDGGDLGFNFEIWDAEEFAIERAALGLFQSAAPGGGIADALSEIGFARSHEDPMLFERDDAWISVDAAFSRAYLESGDDGAGIDFRGVDDLLREVKRLLADLDELAAAAELTDELADSEHEKLIAMTAERIKRAAGDTPLELAAMVLFEAGAARIAALTGSKLTPAELLEVLVTDEDGVAARLHADEGGKKRLARLYTAARANMPPRM